MEPSTTPRHVVRMIRPDDAARLQAFHSRLSPDTVHLRFFGAHPVLGDAEARQLTNLVAGEQVALVATVGDDIVGVGRYIRIGRSSSAEVAFVIADGHQGHGIGTELLTLLSRLATDDGIDHFVADTLVGNTAMLDVFLHTPAAVAVQRTSREGSVIHLVMAVVPPRRDLAASTS